MKFKKFFLILLLVLVVLFYCACEKKSSTTYKVIYDNSSGANIDKFDLSDIKLRIENDNLSVNIDVTKDMISDSDYEALQKVGTHTITIKYKGYEEKVVVTLVEATSSDINQDTNKDTSGVQFDMEYYASANGLYGEDLKKALRKIISKTKKTESYDDLRQDLQKTDAGSTGTIVCFYCHKEMNATWDGGKTWNREHIWPQSLGWFSTTMAGADIHHLRPAHQGENSSRGNTPYGTSSMYYVPKDNVKGDVARILFYMYTRYKEADSYSLLTVCEDFSMLLEWNKLDPVDDLERQRNEVGYSIQGNRNPFIDNPSYADYIWQNA